MLFKFFKASGKKNMAVEFCCIFSNDTLQQSNMFVLNGQVGVKLCIYVEFPLDD